LSRNSPTARQNLPSVASGEAIYAPAGRLWRAHQVAGCRRRLRDLFLWKQSAIRLDPCQVIAIKNSLGRFATRLWRQLFGCGFLAAQKTCPVVRSSLFRTSHRTEPPNYRSASVAFFRDVLFLCAA
jgi:hypothetical protein